MTIDRRRLLAGGAALLCAARFGFNPAAAADSPAVGALARSRLIYLSPILAGGEDSSCHGEVWFVRHDDDVFVCTQSGAWRAEAVRRGLTRARVWIGEFGVWTRAEQRYRSAPYLELEGRLEADRAVHTAVLSRFGEKYTDEWGAWGPRFRAGLADGSRVLLRYRIVS